jgi:hypothetical protein
MWIVYKCDRVQRGQRPTNEVEVCRRATVPEAMDEANRLRRGDPRHSYTVGGD